MRTLSVVLAGSLAALLGVALLLPLPEAGVPLLLLGLRLLGRRYAWARRANARVDASWSAVRRWFHGQRPGVKALVVVVLVALAAGLALLAVHELSSYA